MSYLGNNIHKDRVVAQTHDLVRKHTEHLIDEPMVNF